MKDFKWVYAILGVIPFLWLSSFLSILVIGTLSLGYIPAYGNASDPDSLNLGALGMLHVFFLLASYFAIIPWIFISIEWIISRKHEVKPPPLPVYLFLIGMAGYFVFRYIFPAQFAWVFD